VSNTQTIEKLLRQQAALANFGSFAFRESDLQKVLTEAAAICAHSLDVPFAKICRHRVAENDLLVEAGYGWHDGVIGNVISKADESSTQGRAFVTGEPVIVDDLSKDHSFQLPSFYGEHGIVATADVLIKGAEGAWGVLEVDSTCARVFDSHDVVFLTGFANVVAEAAATATRNSVLRTANSEMADLIIDKDRLLREREVFLEEKEVSAEELQHRVRNNLQLVLGMLNQQIDLGADAETEGLRGIARRVMSLAKVYDHLLGNGLTRTIDVDRYLRSLCDSLQEFQADREFPVTLSFKGDPNPLPLDLDTVTALGIVVAETVSNAYLHAFPERTGTISVRLNKGSPNATLCVSDDGVGFVEPVSSKRHGVGLLRRLVEQIGGTVILESGVGATWRIAFPARVDELRQVE
jgi:two-component sensor histidine kinase